MGDSAPGGGLQAACSEFDVRVSSVVHRLELGPLDYLIAVPCLMCSYFGVPFIILLMGLLCGLSAGAAYLCLVLCCVVFTLTMKRLTARERPQPLGARMVQLRKTESNKSFPSGDSMQAGLLFTILIQLSAESGLPLHAALVLCMLAVMFARVYFGIHWIGDTIAGACAGVAIACIGWRPLSHYMALSFNSLKAHT
eukprot:TRINITY_DN16408_c0_g1_i1.p3 TRINITY_DN16408_c0_g1~~TRINITY_DN16408_c0_g1_i1.p3  ORF type:complete len:230 (+),score=84.68 TRINITY_DN16408_c0_g1_i1:103-690(+)